MMKADEIQDAICISNIGGIDENEKAFLRRYHNELDDVVKTSLVRFHNGRVFCKAPSRHGRKIIHLENDLVFGFLVLVVPVLWNTLIAKFMSGESRCISQDFFLMFIAPLMIFGIMFFAYRKIVKSGYPFLRLGSVEYGPDPLMMAEDKKIIEGATRNAIMKYFQYSLRNNGDIDEDLYRLLTENVKINRKLLIDNDESIKSYKWYNFKGIKFEIIFGQ